jgi:hypothetical protein
VRGLPFLLLLLSLMCCAVKREGQKRTIEMAFVTTVNGDVCQQPGPPDGTPIPASDACRGRQVEALPSSMWLVGLDDANSGPNDNDFWDVFLKLTFGPQESGWVEMRYEYLGGETAHQVEVKIEEQWIGPLQLGQTVELNPVMAGDSVRFLVKDWSDHSVGHSPDPGVIWAAQVANTETPEPETWGMVLAAGLVLVAGRVRRWLAA